VAAIILPSRFTGQQKGLAGVDYGNSSSRGLSNVWLSSNGAIVERVSGNKLAAITGAPKQGESYLGGPCFEFNGTSEYASLGAPPQTMDTLPLSISVWFNATSLSRSQTIIGYGSGAVAPYSYFDLGITSANNIRFRRYNGASFTHSGTTTVSPGWHNLTLSILSSYSGNSVYLDGKVEITGFNFNTTNARADSYNRLTLAYPVYTSDATYFNGRIDDVRFYNRALTEIEALNIYSNPGQIFRSAKRVIYSFGSSFPVLTSLGVSAITSSGGRLTASA
jgi:hypothetical protein